MSAPPEPLYLDPALNLQRVELIRFLEYWKTKRGEKMFPGRADISPRALPAQLPWLHMYDVLSAGTDFRIRLIGTTLSDLLPARNLRGKPISALPPFVQDRLRHALEWVMQNRAPLRTYNSSTAIPGQGFQGSESCFLPLSNNDADIDVIIAVTMLENRK